LRLLALFKETAGVVHKGHDFLGSLVDVAHGDVVVVD
jgi:hypothetical protein